MTQIGFRQDHWGWAGMCFVSFKLCHVGITFHHAPRDSNFVLHISNERPFAAGMAIMETNSPIIHLKVLRFLSPRRSSAKPFIRAFGTALNHNMKNSLLTIADDAQPQHANSDPWCTDTVSQTHKKGMTELGGPGCLSSALCLALLFASSVAWRRDRSTRDMSEYFRIPCTLSQISGCSRPTAKQEHGQGRGSSIGICVVPVL